MSYIRRILSPIPLALRDRRLCVIDTTIQRHTLFVAAICQNDCHSRSHVGRMNEVSPTTSFLSSRVFFWLLGIVGLGLFILIISSKVTPYLYFARIPLLSLLLFAAVTPFLATHNLRSLLIGAYDLTGFSDGISSNRHDFREGVALGLVLVLCGMTIYTTATLAMELGPVRLEAAPLVAIAPWEKWVLGLIIW